MTHVQGGEVVEGGALTIHVHGQLWARSVQVALQAHHAGIDRVRLQRLDDLIGEALQLRGILSDDLHIHCRTRGDTFLHLLDGDLGTGDVLADVLLHPGERSEGIELLILEVHHAEGDPTAVRT